MKSISVWLPAMVFGYITDCFCDATMANGLRFYSPKDYYHGFVLMLVFTAIAVAGPFRLRKIYCRNIFTIHT